MSEQEQKLEERVEQLTKELEEARREAAENYDRFLRARAELENYRKRVQREKADLMKFGNEQLLRELLPALDHLELAIRHAKESRSLEALVQGVELTLNQIMEVMERFGVRPIEAVGQPFDPTKHEAVSQVETDEHEPGTVIEEVQRGYAFHERLLRPSRVTVAKAPQRGEPEA